MAGNSVIGALRIAMGIDAGSLEDGLKGASAKLDDFAKKAAVTGAAIGAAIGGALVALGAGIKGTIDQADQLGKLSKSLAIPVKDLSEYKYAADAAGVASDDFFKSLGKLNSSVTSASTNLKGAAASAFNAIGVSVRDANGNLKSSSQVLGEVADKFSGYRDSAAKTAVATALFGRAGAGLIPMLNEGSSGIERLRNEADNLGVTLDDKAVGAATDFKNNMKALGVMWDVLVTKVTANLLPVLQQLSAKFSGLAKDGDIAKGIAETIGSAFMKLVEVTMTVITAWQRLGIEWNALREFLKTDIFSGKLTENWNKFLETGEETKRVMAELHASFQNGVAGATTFGSGASNAGKGLKDLILPTKEAKNAVDSFLSSQAKRAAQMQADAEGLRMTTAEAAAYRMEQQAITIATEKNIPLTDELMNKIFSAATAYGQTAEQVERVRDRFNQLRQVGEQVGSAIGSVFQNGITKGGKFSDVLKNLAGKLADIAFQFEITKPLQNIFGSMFSAAPLKLFGFASGGSFNVGGSGGIDSQLVAFKASPNEQVSVTKPGQSGGGGGSYVYAPQYNFSPGMTPTDMASIRAQMAMADRQTEERTIGRIRRAHQTDSGFLNG